MDERSLEITPYNSVYQNQISALLLNILKEFHLPETLNDQPDLKEISKVYQKEGGNFWVALYNGQIIGTVALISMGNGQGALKKMFVDKAHRGKEKKVAQLLLGTVLAWCKKQKIKEIYLGTRSIFLAAHKFYEKNGFIEIPQAEIPNTFPINPVDSKFYVRHLWGQIANNK
jgi:N-acetylglutamate synthase-like GNAT family acetyltransferase